MNRALLSGLSSLLFPFAAHAAANGGSMTEADLAAWVARNS